MRNILLVIAMLVIAMPALATVSVTATDKGSGVVEVRYNCSAAEKVRSFALDISVDSGMTIDNIRDFNSGESKVPGGGYGIFLGKFASFINPAGPNWADTNYNPVGRMTDPNTRSGLGTGQITVELGTLYADANAPGTSGLLFRLDINNHGASVGNLSIVPNNTRIVAVLEDTSVIQPVLTGTMVTFAPPCLVPDFNGMNRVPVRQAIINAGWIVGAEANVAPTNPNQHVGDIIGQRPPPGSPCPPFGSPIDINVVSYPIKEMPAANSLYVNWVNRGRPRCWAYPRQCNGDADSKRQLAYWISNNDLAILRTAINKSDSQLPVGGICADFDHKKQLVYWVSNNDLAILRLYIAKSDSQVPICGNIPTAQAGFSTDPNYWYFCEPSGTVCPTGQYCAPSGICPNTP